MKSYDQNLWFRYLSMRNFLSFGNQEQIIQLGGDLMSVIMGENLDTGGEDSRNGAGKSAIIDAICFTLFGRTLRGSTNQELINDLIARGQPMVVQVAFDKGKYSYLVERGEKPGKLLLLRKPRDSEEDFFAREARRLKFDISLSSKKETTSEITKLLGYNLPLFSFLVANSSESTSFFKLREDERREVSENLFGFTILSERAERLKKLRKFKKDELMKAETAHATETQANKRIEREIEEMERRARSWGEEKERAIDSLKKTIETLESVDMEMEIDTLTMIGELQGTLKDIGSKLSDLQHRYSSLEKDKKIANREIDDKTVKLGETESKIKDLNESKCPTCKQQWEPDPDYRTGLEAVMEELPPIIHGFKNEISIIDGNLTMVETEYAKCEDNKTIQADKLARLTEEELTFGTTEQAAEASASLKMYRDNLEAKLAAENPHTESIKGLRDKAVTKEDDSVMKHLRKLVHHFNFMIELLTSKDSYIRRSIIDQWLPKLNERIAYYLDILELQHNVAFQPDLSVEILKFQKKKGWGNLSKGERMRLIIALNFSFQDVFEYMNYRINLLCVDELLDNGLCSRGAERTVDLLKAMGAESHKRVMLITHRDDIAARVDHMMIVQKENDLSKVIEAE